MLHTHVRRFDVMNTVGKNLGTKQVLNRNRKKIHKQCRNTADHGGDVAVACRAIQSCTEIDESLLKKSMRHGKLS